MQIRLTAVAVAFVWSGSLAAQPALAQPGSASAPGSQRGAGSMPPGMSHEEHQRQMQKDAELEKRGAAAMGFDQKQTVHHFRLEPDGGAIEVTVRSPADELNRTLIRRHLEAIAREFTAGDFQKPFMTHGEQPDGVDEMLRRRRAISYTFEAMPEGGRVRIRTADPAALAAVHRFLRYQIREHSTGDSMTVPKQPPTHAPESK